MTLSIDTAFDGGNIAVVAIRDADAAIDLAIARDRYSAFYQWFFFRLAGAAGRTTRCASSMPAARPSRRAGRTIRSARAATA